MSYNPSQHKNYDMTESAIDDRITALEAATASLEGNPVVPSLPSKNGFYRLNSLGAGDLRIYSWAADEMPSLPTAAGQYALKVEVSGSTKTYSWVDITPAASVEEETT